MRNLQGREAGAAAGGRKGWQSGWTSWRRCYQADSLMGVKDLRRTGKGGAKALRQELPRGDWPAVQALGVMSICLLALPCKRKAVRAFHAVTARSIPSDSEDHCRSSCGESGGGCEGDACWLEGQAPCLPRLPSIQGEACFFLFNKRFLL